MPTITLTGDIEFPYQVNWPKGGFTRLNQACESTKGSSFYGLEWREAHIKLIQRFYPAFVGV